MSKQVQTAAVIGGGIAGPVAAMALRRAGIEATVYEAYPSRADSAGGTLALAPNGVAALELVGAAAPVRRMAVPLGRQRMVVGGRRVEIPPLSGVEPLQLVHRSELYRVLHERADADGVRFEYGRRLVEAREEAGRVTALFEDGTTADSDVLIGADGVHSRVRGIVDPAAPAPGYTGLLGLEAVSDFEPEVEPGTISFTFGRRAYYLYWREPGGGTRWGINLPSRRPMSSAEARAVSEAEWLDRLVATYGEDSPGADLVHSIRPGSLQATGGLHIMPPVPNWHRGRIVLVGDAVHAPSNSSGQGASLAVESAIQLARCLRDVDDVPSAFAAYERMRRSRVEGVAARASKINYAKAPGPIARAIMPLMMRLALKTVMNPERTMGAEQRYRIDWDAPVAAAAPVR